MDEGLEGNSDEIELSLSLGGCFSSRDSETSRLFRSSSIPTGLPSEFPPTAPLIRACSLPNEAEEEIRRRKGMQSIKRLQTKRKREEKRKSKRRDEDFEGGSSGKKTRRFEIEQNGVVSSLRRFPPASQGSVASQGSSSSGESEFESRLRQGLEFVGFQSVSNAATAECGNQSVPQTSKPVNCAELNLFGKNGGKASPSGLGQVGTSSVEDMPSVSTRGAGPNGRRIEGFLYRYGTGEDVSIVCVCHGSFLTPAEFVKHAGGGDVAHPLRHIVVNTSPDVFS